MQTPRRGRISRRRRVEARAAGQVHPPRASIHATSVVGPPPAGIEPGGSAALAAPGPLRPALPRCVPPGRRPPAPRVGRASRRHAGWFRIAGRRPEVGPEKPHAGHEARRRARGGPTGPGVARPVVQHRRLDARPRSRRPAAAPGARLGVGMVRRRVLPRGVPRPRAGGARRGTAARSGPVRRRRVDSAGSAPARLRGVRERY